jgi:hypothetical protein
MIQNDTIGKYNGLSAVFRQNGFKGLTMMASYTYSKMLDMATDSNGGSNVMDPFNTQLDYGQANWDLKHRFVSSFNYEIPFMKSNPNAALRLALGGWQMNGIFTAQGGFPFGAILAADQANVGQGLWQSCEGGLRLWQAGALRGYLSVLAACPVYLWQHSA